MGAVSSLVRFDAAPHRMQERARGEAAKRVWVESTAHVFAPTTVLR